MLIFGKSIGDWKEKAAYAQDKADNELAEIREVRCEEIEDVQTAFEIMAAFAADSNCKKFLYHATINLNPAERLTKEQWMKAVDTLEKNLKLTGHYRVVFEHIKKDRQHYHIVWSRIPPQGGAAVNMGNDFFVHQNTAKALEKEFGLAPAPRRDSSKPSHKKEEINAKNSAVRVKPEIVTAEVTRIFKESDTTRDFVKSLTDAGYVLTRGKNDSLVLVDKQGGYHGLLRRIDGAKLAEVRRKFPELGKLPLPPLNEVLAARRPAGTSFKGAAKGVGRRRARQSQPKRRLAVASVKTQCIRIEREEMPQRTVRRKRTHNPKPSRTYRHKKRQLSALGTVKQVRQVKKQTVRPTHNEVVRHKSPERTVIQDSLIHRKPEMPEIDSSRAAAAYEAEFIFYQMGIEAAQKDLSLTPEQRAQTIKILKERQQIGANAARQRVLEEESSRIEEAARLIRSTAAKPTLGS